VSAITSSLGRRLKGGRASVYRRKRRELLRCISKSRKGVMYLYREGVETCDSGVLFGWKSQESTRYRGGTKRGVHYKQLTTEERLRAKRRSSSGKGTPLTLPTRIHFTEENRKRGGVPPEKGKNLGSEGNLLYVAPMWVSRCPSGGEGSFVRASWSSLRSKATSMDRTS